VTATFRFLQLLALGCWLGGIVYFIVFTQGIFSVLPTKDMTGLVVGYSLSRLHVLGIITGCIYLVATAAYEKSVGALVRPAALLVLLMILATMVSQYGVIARMDALRLQIGSIEAAAAGSPLLAQFNRLHQYSVQLEMVVLLSGLTSLFLTARPK
jgi:hypothetical protein